VLRVSPPFVLCPLDISPQGGNKHILAFVSYDLGFGKLIVRDIELVIDNSGSLSCYV
jgi:hypothetical protein